MCPCWLTQWHSFILVICMTSKRMRDVIRGALSPASDCQPRNILCQPLVGQRCFCPTNVQCSTQLPRQLWIWICLQQCCTHGLLVCLEAESLTAIRTFADMFLQDLLPWLLKLLLVLCCPLGMHMLHLFLLRQVRRWSILLALSPGSRDQLWLQRTESALDRNKKANDSRHILSGGRWTCNQLDDKNRCPHEVSTIISFRKEKGPWWLLSWLP